MTGLVIVVVLLLVYGGFLWLLAHPEKWEQL